MAFTAAPNSNDTPTGANTTRLVLDGTEYIATDDGWGGSRFYGSVGAAASTQGQSSSEFAYHCYQWKSGCWTPETIPLGILQEKDLPQPAEYVPSAFASGGVLSANTVPVQLVNVWNAPTLPGLSAQSNTTSAGGRFFRRIIAAGASFLTGLPSGATVLTPPASIDNFSGVIASPPTSLAATAGTVAGPVPTNLTQPLTPVAQDAQTAPANQGFEISWILPAGTLNATDVSGVFFFGGSNGGNHPQFGLRFRGDGNADLLEYAQPIGGGNFNWYFRFSFRYCLPSEVCNTAHTVQIFPHVGPEGQKFIAFRSGNLDHSQGQSGGGAPSNIDFYTARTGLNESLYKWDQASAGTIDNCPGSATGAGSFWLLERADLRHYWHVHRLAWYCQGTLRDGTWGLPVYGTSRTFVTQGVGQIAQNIGAFAGFPPALAIQLYDSATNTPVTTSGAVTGGSVYPIFTLTGTFYWPTILWGYCLSLPAVTQEVAPGTFTPPITDVSITGPEGDMRHESAQVTIVDVAAQYPRLATRGSFPARIETDLPISGVTKTIVLARGYAERPEQTRKGKQQNNGFGNQGAPVVYPSPNWRELEMTFGGMWLRLSRTSAKTALTPPFFRFDPNAVPDPATGYLPGYKITDIIRALLGRAGFPASMINIPDINYRVLPGIGASPSDFKINPHNSLADLIFALARNYLGAYLAFDANSGGVIYDRLGGTAGAPIGRWTLLMPPATGAASLINFTTMPAAEAGPGFVAPHHLGNYPANTTYSIGDIRSRVIPPAKNKIIVATVTDTANGGVRFENEAVNPFSYPVPGSGVTPDPNSSHYIGYESLIILPDPALWGGDGTFGSQRTQHAIDFTVRQLFTFYCLPRVVQPLVCPFIPVTDPQTGQLRPARYYDPATLTTPTGTSTNWYVRNCNPRYRRSNLQLMYTEIEQLVSMPT